MRDHLYIGESPADELCAQVGSDGYTQRAMKECRVLIAQLRRQFGPEKGSAQLKILPQAHDFGTYYSVVCYYNDNDEEGVEYAYACEGGLPEKWDEEAKLALQ